ncbi:MAG TPA: VTT domain-containing protein [Kiritimatiellia bacterium]|nr:VTT domain-containing protein [Kiritimatiellia bacterium]
MLAAWTSKIEPATWRALARMGGFALILGGSVAILHFTGWYKKFNPDDLVVWVGGWGWKGMAALAGLAIITPIMMLPRWPIAVTAGLLYGVLAGALFATFASALGALVHYYLSRNLLAPMARRALVRYKLDKVIVPKPRQFLLVFMFRVIPFTSFTLTNLVSGALRFHSSRFFWASLIGMFPTSLMFAAGGRALTDPGWEFYGALALMVAVSSVGILLAGRVVGPFLAFLRQRPRDVPHMADEAGGGDRLNPASD